MEDSSNAACDSGNADTNNQECIDLDSETLHTTATNEFLLSDSYSIEDLEVTYELVRDQDYTSSNALRNKVSLINAIDNFIKKFNSEMRDQTPRLKIRHDQCEGLNKFSIINPNSKNLIQKSKIGNNNDGTKQPIVNIKQCFDNWKKKYPWIEIKLKNILCCKTCSANSSHSCIVWKIESSGDIFKTASKLLKHSELPKHIILTYVAHIVPFRKIYFLLKHIPIQITSKELLYDSINEIMKCHKDIELTDEVINLVIKTIALTIDDILLKMLQERGKDGISFVCDPGRRILIAKIFSCDGNLEEHVLIDFMNNTSSVLDYLKSKCLEEHITLINIFNSSSNLLKNIFPLKYPKIEELDRWMMSNNEICAYSQFVNGLSKLYQQYKTNFDFIENSLILSNARWTNANVYLFLIKNRGDINIALTRIYKATSDVRTKHFCNYIIDEGLPFHDLIQIISNIMLYYQTLQLSITIDRREQFKYIASLYLVKVEKKVHWNSPYVKALEILYLFCREIVKNEYHIGKTELNMLNFLLQPERLKDLNTTKMPKEMHYFEKIFIALKSHFPFSYSQCRENLAEFGNYFRSHPNEKIITLQEVFRVFNEQPEIKEKFSIAHKFYICFVNIPPFGALKEISPFNVWANMFHFKSYFGEEIAKYLVDIHFEGPKAIRDKAILNDFINKIAVINI